jgi:hypothetical protein
MSGSLTLDGSVYTPLFASTFADSLVLQNTLGTSLGVPASDIIINSVSQSGDGVVISYSIRVEPTQVPAVQSNIQQLKLAQIYETYPEVLGLSVSAVSVVTAPPAPPPPPSPPPTPPAPPFAANSNTLTTVYYSLIGMVSGALVVAGICVCIACWPTRKFPKDSRKAKLHNDLFNSNKV